MDYSVSYIKDYCKFLNSRGLTNKDLFQKLGASGVKMHIPFLRIKAENANRLFEYAIQKTGDTNIGLKLPCEPWYVPDKIIYMMMWNSKSPLEALRFACKYVKLITTTFAAVFTENESAFSIEFTESSAWLKHKDTWDALIKTTLDTAISTVQNTFPKMFNKTLFPLELRLTLEKPENDELYYEIFKCPVYFNDQKNLMVYDKSVLRKEQNEYYDRTSLEIVLRYADDLIKRQINRSDSFSVIVENEILVMMGKAEVAPNLQTVAKNLNMSIRTFQRKLESEQLNYKDILESVRKNFAMNYINHTEDFNVNDLAYVLGYSDASAFIKAFKRWYGVTPGKFR
jgi:AraC-like DNA-binding protein